MAKRIEDLRRYEITCGCGSKAEYELYADHQKHCRSCMLDAVDCEVPVLVRRIDQR